MTISRSQPDIRRYHPLLPTTAEANVDKTLIMSDHLPILFSLPIGDKWVRAISWNVLLPNVSSGLEARENTDDINLRVTRIRQALLTMMEEQNPDIIILQECFFNDASFTVVLDQMGWRIDTSHPDNSNITLYNPASVEIAACDFQAINSKLDSAYRPSATQQTKFLLNGTSLSFIVNNVHLPHQDLPAAAEKLIVEMLKLSREFADYAIVAGDFNNRYAAINRTFLPNNVVSSAYCDEIGIQGTDFTDGVFVMGADNLCHQPDCVDTLDTSTGKVFATDTLSIFTSRHHPHCHEYDWLQIIHFSWGRGGL